MGQIETFEQLGDLTDILNHFPDNFKVMKDTLHDLYLP